MAETMGLASGLIALARSALQYSRSLLTTIQSFRCRLQRVHDLAEELGALSGVLSGLSDTPEMVSRLELPGLELPLRRCRNACKDFKKELLSYSSRSGRMDTRGWTKLRYMGEDIDGFRRLLARYRMIVNIALADANLRRQTSATLEDLESYSRLVDTAKADFEDHLTTIDEKLEDPSNRDPTKTEQTIAAIKAMKEEQLSITKCLEICTSLSNRIDQLKLTTASNASRASSPKHTMTEWPTGEELAERKSRLEREIQKLKNHETELINQLLSKHKPAGLGSATGVVQLRHDLETTRQTIDLCTRARELVQDDASTIENYAIGDAVQYMVSTNNKTIHGKNRGLGWKTRQAGGYMAEASLQQMIRSLSSVIVVDEEGQQCSSNDATLLDSSLSPVDATKAKFDHRFGDGVKLSVGPGLSEDANSTERAKHRK